MLISTDIFRVLLIYRIFFLVWKIYRILLGVKTRCRGQVYVADSKYPHRPTPAPWACKLLEHIVCSASKAYLDEYQLLSDRQHAFRKTHGCETHVSTVINDWVKILDKGGQVDTFILDFGKAFDTSPPLPTHIHTSTPS